MNRFFKLLAPILAWLLAAPPAPALEPVTDRLVVLTFDDAVKSHFTVAREVLKRYGFGATFFITEGFTFAANKKDYMTWEEIRALHQEGFEIGNHTRGHMGVSTKTLDCLEDELSGIDKRCEEMGIPKPISFAWPGNAIAVEALPILKKHGLRFARRGGSPEYPYVKGRGFAYKPGLDHPLLIPSAGDARPDWTLADFIRAAEQAREGRIAVLQFHGVPEGEHPWVHTPRERFEEYMKHLHDRGYQAIALRDLARYADPDQAPADPGEIIRKRLDLGVTLYTHQLEPRLVPHLELCNVISLWTWKSEDLKDLEANFAALKKLLPEKRLLLGCYLWDFGNQKPMPLERQEKQCELGLRWLLEGRIEGIIFLATNLADLNLEAVEWARAWIERVGGRPAH